jgi:hypothetical protein
MEKKASFIFLLVATVFSCGMQLLPEIGAAVIAFNAVIAAFVLIFLWLYSERKKITDSVILTDGAMLLLYLLMIFFLRRVYSLCWFASITIAVPLAVVLLLATLGLKKLFKR